MTLESDLKFYRTMAVFILFAAFFMLIAPELSARPKYAKAAGQKCATCHVSAKGGGALRPIGRAFVKNKRVWPEERTRWTDPGTTGRQHFRFGVGIVHGLASLIWVIAIVMMLPVLAGRKGTARMATYSISILIATGFVLTLLRFADFKLLPLMLSGRVMLVKIVLSAALLLSIVFQTKENTAGPGEATAPTKLMVMSHCAVALIIAAMLLFVMN